MNNIDAEEQDAIIFYLDESTAKSESHRGRTRASKAWLPLRNLQVQDTV